MVAVIPYPIMIRRISSSRSPTQIENMPKAGMKLEKGIGRGRERKAASKVIARPQRICEARELVTGCLIVASFEVILENLTATL